MDCRELKPDEVIAASDYYQVRYGDCHDRLFPVLYAATMRVADALQKWPHITAFYRPTTHERQNRT